MNCQGVSLYHFDVKTFFGTPISIFRSKFSPLFVLDFFNVGPPKEDIFLTAIYGTERVELHVEDMDLLALSYFSGSQLLVL